MRSGLLFMERRQYGMPITVEWLKQNTITNDRGCWIWQRTLIRGGYAQLTVRKSVRGTTELVHRLIWTLIHGPIPDGLQVLHDCDTPACINPEHLSLGSQSKNMLDCFQRGRKDHKGQLHPRTRLKNEDVITIRNSPLTDKQLSGMFNISESTISNIRTRKTWKHLDINGNITE